ncbi:MAG: hypothetical protein N2444_05295 [Methylocystis sp.]|nr:hypothetical protein [Methylocystis sp.]
MRTKTISGAKIAATAVALILSGAVAAFAEEKPKTADKQTTEKMACGKNGCGKAMEKGANEQGKETAAPGAVKAGAAK